MVALPTLGVGSGEVINAVGGGSELKFWTYSTVMSRPRRLPVLSAANFDRVTQQRPPRPRTWILDPRLDLDPASAKTLQVTDSWYKRQNSAGLGRGPFDRGHLTAFEHATWGEDPARNGADTFHFSNCAPQARAFNEHEVWREIEVWTAQKGGGALCMFNGPVFDAPPSVRRPDGLYELRSFEPATADPVLQGLAIPKQYFKVVAYVEGGTLAVQSFVVTQEDSFASIAELAMGDEAVSEAELALYRVPITTVSHLTGIDFGVLARPDIVINESAGEPELIRSLADL